MVSTVQQDRFAPSPVFLGLVLATVLVGSALWQGNDLAGFGVFLFVLLGWVVSLCLHEFGHAIVAYRAGDRSVAEKGYLTLDVRHYADLGTSLLFPIVILLIGGIGLPGGAVWINHGAIPSKNMRSLVSAAGPAASLLCALICLLPIRLDLIGFAQRPLFAVGLGFLGAIQVIAFLFNMLPVPGLDGFGIIEHHLSPQTRRAIYPYRQYGILILIAALFVIPQVGDAFWSVTDDVSRWIGGDTAALLRSVGWFEFRFWEK